MHLYFFIGIILLSLIGCFFLLIKPKLKRLTYLENILNHNVAGIWLHNDKGQQLLANNYSEKVLGRDEKGIIEDVVSQVLKLKQECTDQVAVTKENSTSYYSVKAAPLQLKDELGILVIMQDITRWKMAEAALQASEERYRKVTELSPNGVIIYGDDKVIYANCTAANIWGLQSEQELYGRCIRDLFEPAYWQTVGTKLEQRLVDRESSNNYVEAQIVNAKGQIKDVELAAGVYFAGERKLGQAIIRDITEQKKMEKELIKASKLESIGVLASGIAHDFNNLLTVIMGNISLAKMRADKESKIYINLVEAEKAAINSIDLTKQLLSFAKGNETKKEVAEVGELLKDSADLILCGSNVTRVYHIDPELWWVEIDKGQIRQVIHNLIINAIQAMPDGGEITVKAENIVHLEGENSTYWPALAPGKYVAIYITDNGIGIPEQILPKIFDPFFTSKEQGNGLGLATCYYIIKKHGGHISVTSSEGKGTTFTIYLPAQDSHEHQENISEAKVVKGKGKILVTDDDSSIRIVAMEMLKQLGYQPEASQDGTEALKMYKEQLVKGYPYDAVIMDLTIPGGMGGIKAVGELLESDPYAKVLLASGYPEDPAMVNYGEYGFKGIITKPYNIEEISNVLKEVIDS